MSSLATIEFEMDDVEYVAEIDADCDDGGAFYTASAVRLDGVDMKRAEESDAIERAIELMHEEDKANSGLF